MKHASQGRSRLADLNFARLNHVFIPETKDARDRMRRTWGGKLFGLALALYFALSAEGRFILGFALMAGVLGLEVRATQGYLLWSAVFAPLVVSLFVRRLFPLRKVTMRAAAPARVAAFETVTFTLELENSGDREQASIRIEGPFLPWDGQWVGRSPALSCLAAQERRQVTLTARFIARGEHHLDPFKACRTVPLSLAMGPPTESAGVRFTVVPRLAPVRRLRTPEGQRHQPGGVALASKTGESFELLGLRPYRPGDRMRDLHARSWARTGTPQVREYQQEYFSRIGVILDTDRTVAPEYEREAAISLAAGVVACLARGEALIDLLVIGHEVHPILLGRSLGTLDQALDHLALVRPGPKLAPAQLAEKLAPHTANLSCMVLVMVSWDAPRQELAERLARAGVPSRILVVGHGPCDDGLTHVSADAIHKGEELFL